MTASRKNHKKPAHLALASSFNRLSLCFLTLVFLGQDVFAQEQAQRVSADRKRVEITRTDLEPEIDGILDDEIWKTATVISDLHQFEPVDHVEPSERSEFYITYNERYFYVGARLYDSDPSGISARIKSM